MFDLQTEPSNPLPWNERSDAERLAFAASELAAACMRARALLAEMKVAAESLDAARQRADETLVQVRAGVTPTP